MYPFKEYDNVYDWISCILPNQIYFGPYPNQLMIDRLLQEQFDTIIDLTNRHEEDLYDTKDKEYISFPVEDNDIPQCVTSYCSLIVQLKKKVFEHKKMYIHCRGGHGRSSMTTVSLYYVLFQTDLKTAIEKVTSSHNSRVVLRSRWKRKKSPFNYQQFLFLSKIHKNIYINMYHYNKYYHWLFYKESITYLNKTYPTIYEMFLDNQIENSKKMLIMIDFFSKKIKENKDLEYKLQLTYLKHFVLSDCQNIAFCTMYQSSLSTVRERLICP